jgi:hypothetical protein
MNFQEAQKYFRAHRAMHESKGIVFPQAFAYLPDEFRHDFDLAMDALPTLASDPNSGVPAMLTTFIDPQTYRVLFAPNEGANILGEQRKGTWIDDTAMFPIVEHTGEVTTYGDYSEAGSAGANTNWPQRQNYVFQTIEEYGDRETERAGLSRLNWVGEIDIAAATVMDKFLNLSYFFGISGLQNYGILNDPTLVAALTPAPKSAGGNAWFRTGVVVATANEIFTDIQSLVTSVVSQSAGLVGAKSPMTLAMSPISEMALTTTNSFNVNVYTLLEKNFPNLKIKTAVQYGAQSTQNTQGLAAGNMMQLIAGAIKGQNAGYAAFSDKMRASPIVRALSSYKKKVVSGTWGAVLRQYLGIGSMIGI